MAIDIEFLMKHSLPTQDIVILAQELADKLCYNTRYGYQNDGFYNQLLQHKIEDDFVVLGEVILDSKDEFASLYDDHYQVRQLYAQCGEGLYAQLANIYPSKSIGNIREQYQNKLKWHSYFYDYAFGSYNITDEYLLAYERPFLNWWGLCDAFIKEEPKTYPNHPFALQSLRFDALFSAKKFEADKVYYVHSGCVEGCIYVDKMSWQEMEGMIIERSGHLLLDVSRFILDVDYKKMFLSYQDEPYAFIDDFEDIKALGLFVDF